MFILELIKIVTFMPVFLFYEAIVLRAARLVHASVDFPERPVELPARLSLIYLAFDEHGFGELFSHAHDGIEAGHGILEYHGDFVAADLVKILFADFHQILSVVDDLAALFDGVARENPHDGAVRHRFSRAAFSDDGERFSLVKVKTYVSYRLYFSSVRPERNFQRVYGEFYFFFFHCHPSVPLNEGLNASLRPFPNKLKLSMSKARKMDGNNAIYGAVDK